MISKRQKSMLANTNLFWLLILIYTSVKGRLKFRPIYTIIFTYWLNIIEDMRWKIRKMNFNGIKIWFPLDLFYMIYNLYLNF